MRLPLVAAGAAFLILQATPAAGLSFELSGRLDFGEHVREPVIVGASSPSSWTAAAKRQGTDGLVLLRGPIDEPPAHIFPQSEVHFSAATGQEVLGVVAAVRRESDTAIYWIDVATWPLSPQLVKTFSGLRPLGVAASGANALGVNISIALQEEGNQRSYLYAASLSFPIAWTQSLLLDSPREISGPSETREGRRLVGISESQDRTFLVYADTGSEWVSQEVYRSRSGFVAHPRILHASNTTWLTFTVKGGLCSDMGYFVGKWNSTERPQQVAEPCSSESGPLWFPDGALVLTPFRDRVIVVGLRTGAGGDEVVASENENGTWYDRWTWTDGGRPSIGLWGETPAIVLHSAAASSVEVWTVGDGPVTSGRGTPAGDSPAASVAWTVGLPLVLVRWVRKGRSHR